MHASSPHRIHTLGSLDRAHQRSRDVSTQDPYSQEPGLAGQLSGNLALFAFNYPSAKVSSLLIFVSLYRD